MRALQISFEYRDGNGGHVTCAVRIGQVMADDATHERTAGALALAGSVVMRREEWDLLVASVEPGQPDVAMPMLLPRAEIPVLVDAKRVR